MTSPLHGRTITSVAPIDGGSPAAVVDFGARAPARRRPAIVGPDDLAVPFANDNHTGPRLGAGDRLRLVAEGPRE